MDYFKIDEKNALEAKIYAQQIAFAPIMFQAARTLRNLGILAIIKAEGRDGISFEKIVEKAKLSTYGVRVLVEAGLGIQLIILNKDKYKLTLAGFYIMSDDMTIANLDFVHDICYKGMFDLENSIVTEKPTGLKELGEWKTVYEGLSSLTEQQKESWFKFDHYYSDYSFNAVFKHVFKNNPKRILDIGGNTGKWALKCINYSDTVHMGLVDLPGQLKMAQENIKKDKNAERVSFYEMNILEESNKLPKGYDVIWMSQFLDCFSEDEIVSILKRCFDALNENGEVIILEHFWDRQKFEVSAFCLQMTSLYFTNIANGNSQMYHSDLFKKLVRKAGFNSIEEIDGIGVSSSLLICKK